MLGRTEIIIQIPTAELTSGAQCFLLHIPFLTLALLFSCFFFVEGMSVSFHISSVMYLCTASWYDLLELSDVYMFTFVEINGECSIRASDHFPVVVDY